MPQLISRWHMNKRINSIYKVINLIISKKIITLFILIIIFQPPANAGLVVYGTRFIVTGERPATAVTVENTGTINYLVKSSIESGDSLTSTKTENNSHNEKLSEDESALIITPPLTMIKPGRSHQFLISCIKCDTLPQEHESLFRLSVSAIPSGKAEPNSVQIAIRSRFKLFYRPTGLTAEKARRAYKNLLWSYNHGDLLIYNPTAYYVTLYQLSIDGRDIPSSNIIAPFSTRHEKWCNRDNDCSISWRTIDDYGKISKKMKIIANKERKTGKEVISDRL